MADQSHREEMSAAIRAQRERQAVPRTIAPEPSPQRLEAPERDEQESPPEPKGFFRRFRGA